MSSVKELGNVIRAYNQYHNAKRALYFGSGGNGLQYELWWVLRQNGVSDEWGIYGTPDIQRTAPVRKDYRK